MLILLSGFFRRYFLWVSLLLLLNRFSNAQKISEHPVNTVIQAHYGFVLPHHSGIEYLINENVFAFEVSVGKTLFQKAWHHQFKHPETGLSFYSGSLGNKEYFGHAFALYPYFSNEFLSGKRHSFHYKLGLGLGWVEKNFDAVSNYQNIAIGSHLNAFLSLSMQYRFQLSPSFLLFTELGNKHFSNGAIRLPNKGLNSIMAGIGVKYSPKKLSEKYAEIISYENDHCPSNNRINVVVNGGARQTTILDKKRYFKGSLSLNYLHPVRQKYYVGFGTDFFYDFGADRSRWTETPKTGFQYRFRNGVYGSADLLLGNVSLYFHIGVYTFAKIEPESYVYDRIGIRYKISDKWLANLSLKTHLGRADFIEWGMGYSFPVKKKK